jgi:hypothetical protein
MALLMHSMSWSIMILLPPIFLFNVQGFVLLAIVIINAFIHYVVDNEKANKLRINLMVDQTFHIMQIFITWAIIWQWV